MGGPKKTERFQQSVWMLAVHSPLRVAYTISLEVHLYLSKMREDPRLLYKQLVEIKITRDKIISLSDWPKMLLKSDFVLHLIVL